MSSLDLLNSTLAQMGTLKGGFVNQFATRKPLWNKLLAPNKVNKATLAGTRYEIPYAYGAPAKATKLVSGFEQAPIVGANVINKFLVESQRHLAIVNIPGIEIRKNDGKQGVIKLIKQYPATQMEAMLEDYEYWFLTGAYRDSSISAFDTPQLDGFATLNGAVTHSNGDGGWLQAVAFASQTGTFQGVSRSPSAKLANQYGTITSFAADGMSVIRRVQNDCAQYMGAPDFGFADGITYANLQASLADSVRTVNTGENVDGEEVDMWLPLGSTRIYNCSVNLDPTNSAFTGTALSSSDITGGVLYFVNSKALELATLEEGKTPQFQELQTQDVFAGKVKFDMMPLTDRLACHGIVTGGRIP